MQNYEEEYFKPLSGLVMVTGTSSHGVKLAKYLSNSSEVTNSNLNFVFQESLDFPKIQEKENFLNRAYNPDKTLTPNIRFGILPIHWITKYVQQKPAVIIFAINIADTALASILTNLDEIYNAIEEFIRKNKIKIVFVLLSKSPRMEEEKTVIKTKYELCNKVITGSSDKPEDIYKDVESLVRSYCKKFYQTKIMKYKENLGVGNPDQPRFQEFYLRNLLKIAFLFVLNNESAKAAKYFERAQSVALRIQELFAKFSEANLSISKEEEGLQKFYFYIQKCEEAHRLSNLSRLWMLYIKLRDRDITIMEAFRAIHQHIMDLEKHKFWHLTNTPHFEVLAKIHLFRCFFLMFGDKLIKLSEILVKIQLLSLTKNLFSVILQFVENMPNKGRNSNELYPNYFGLLLIKENNINDRNELLSLNIQSQLAYTQFEENLSCLPALLEAQVATINRCYDDQIKRLINVNFLQISRIQRCCHDLTFSDIYANFLLIDSFQKFEVSKRKAIEFIKNDCHQKHPQIVIKEMIDYDKFHQKTFESIAIRANQNEPILVSLDNKDFFIDSVFATNKIENYEQVVLNFVMRTPKTFLKPYLQKVSLIFSHADYNKDIVLDSNSVTIRDGQLYVAINESLKLNNPQIEVSNLSLSTIYIIYNDHIFFCFDQKLPIVSKTVNKLTIVPVQAISIETDFGKEVILNNQFVPLDLKLKKNITNREDFEFSSLKMRIKPFISKETIRSIKLYKETPGDDEANKLSLLSHDALMKNEVFPIVDQLTEPSLTKNYFLKIKLTQDSEIEIEILISAIIKSKRGDYEMEKFFSFKRKILVKCAFSISKTIQTLSGRAIKKLDEKENEMRIERGIKNFINFYLKANVNQVEIQSFEFIPSEITTIMDNIHSFESPVFLEALEGINNGIIFSISEACSQKNLGNLKIIWRQIGNQYFSKNSFKSLLIVDCYELPFDLQLHSPVRATYSDFFQIKAIIKNKSIDEKRVVFSLGGSEHVFVAGMINKQFTLIPGEQKEIPYALICTKTGIVKLPECQLTMTSRSSGESSNYLVKLPKNVFVEYRRDD